MTAATEAQRAAFSAMAFNPRQLRGPGGRWIDSAGSPGPTRSSEVKLPPRSPVKAAPRAAIFTDGWMHREDPAERAAGFWQGRFSDQRAIRQVFRNIATGKGDPTDGLNLDTDRNWDMTYLRAEQPPPRGVGWEEWTAQHGGNVPRVYDRDDLRDELVNAGRWLHEALAAAPTSTAPLYRGLRMDRADVPKVGDSWDSDVISWAEDRGWAEVYAGMEEDPTLGRVGKTEVVLRLSGKKRSVDLGPEYLDEHLTQGRYRVTRVTGTGNRRFVTVEEVTE